MNDKKVLIISYVWPPMEGVGLVRALKFAKYLPAYGWQPLVLTAKSGSSTGNNDTISLPDVRVFRTDYRDPIEEIRKLSPFRRNGCACGAPSAARAETPAGCSRRPSLLRELILMPDDQIGWHKFGIEEGGKIIAAEHVDMIFSTSPPETAHLIGRRLKKMFGIPWVADLRDLWAEDHFRQRPMIKKMVLKSIERRVLKDADAVITVSEPWAETLRRSIGGPPGKVKVVENAFDEEDFKPFTYKSNDKFTITYTGKLHRDKQPLDLLFKTMRDLMAEGRIDGRKMDVRFHVLGYDKPDIEGMAVSYNLSGIVRDMGKLGYRESLEAQRSADALLFVQWQGRGGEGWYSAKLYDYIGSRRPILALARKGSIVDELIRKTSCGLTADTGEDLRSALAGLYDEFTRNGNVRYDGKETEIRNLSRKLRAGELAGIFDSLIDRARA
ncbi:MAG: glycosyltransferase [Candidatus Omnitrophica bacterium]|nr:glycosyltransferase [Candidatus Omnitrophota bacterium]